MKWRTKLRLLVGVLCALACAACFGKSTPQRSYYVLQGVTTSLRDTQPIVGSLRVRNLDAASIYEKFQIVVRRNPYELKYSEDNVWAVKPNRMVSDVIARALADAHVFTGVTRELGELRPDYILSGNLHAIEAYDSGNVWYAHLSLSLTLTRYGTGESLYTYSFDERKPVPGRTFAQSARAISELLSTALDGLIVGLERVDAPRVGTVRVAPANNGREEEEETNEHPKPPGIIFVPEEGAQRESEAKP